MDKIHAFLDESGAFGFNFNTKNCSTHLIIACVLIKEDDLNTVSEKVENIRKLYFQSGEIKSSHIKNKLYKKRIEILKRLLELPFNVALLVVDKRKIPENTYIRKYKKTFYKFIYRQLYTALISKIKDISIHSDEIGGTEDLEEFKKYYYKKSDPYSMFHDVDFAFDDSKNSLMVQVADFIAGCVAKCIDESRKCDFDDTDYLSIIREKILYRQNFPWTKETFLTETQFDSDDDKKISEIALLQVDDYLNLHQFSEDIDEKQRVAVLDYLRFRFISNQFRKYISTKELINNLVCLGYDRMNASTFRMKIIANLRDNGVIISSSSSGYKIPCKVSEVYDFINHGRNVILPMLHRLRTCNETIRLATNGSINLFERAEYKQLSDLLNINN